MEEKERANAAEGGSTFQQQRKGREASVRNPGGLVPITCITACVLLHVAVPLEDLVGYWQLALVEVVLKSPFWHICK